MFFLFIGFKKKILRRLKKNGAGLRAGRAFLELIC